ncbi:unnamed protein product [Rhizophagus irregularis]|uniref:Uncharacterized protein n=1 Tax=Rhizophagus irregularis (strain DAOM 197198w) TaxID=1432141 RepID=A0A015I9Q1_RHIIW|nr:hypothetical protein RirG_270020 [Rhizophagus irregularis DAOM 197198w]CAB5124980.1 unnamed protein product [Rhizophagus irregularis]
MYGPDSCRNSKWEKTVKVPENFCPICIPPNTAGPDILVAFHFPIADEVPLYEDDDIKLKDGNFDLQPLYFWTYNYLRRPTLDDMSLDERDDMPLDDMLLDEEDYNEEDRKSYILNVQAKLRKTYVLKQSFKTVEPDQMFTDKNYNSNPPGANSELHKIYKEQNWIDRNIKMIVIYSCNS